MCGRILVTGGCGFIGSNLVPRLETRGHAVRVLDNLCTGKPEALEGSDAALVIGDVRDEVAVAKAIDGAGAVVHLAAQTGVIDSIERPAEDLAVNAVGTLNLLQACVAAGVKRFVFASSGAPLGEQSPPVNEGKVPRPLSPYGASKLAGEAYCSVFHAVHGLETVSLRFSNVYGPRCLHKGSVVAVFMRRILSGLPLTIYGDGCQTRDLIFVEDICAAVELALASQDAGGELFQIGTGQETRILDLANTIEEMSGLDVEIVHESARRGEIVRNYCDIAKARSVLGFEPRTSLREGLVRTWQYISESFTPDAAGAG